MREKGARRAEQKKQYREILLRISTKLVFVCGLGNSWRGGKKVQRDKRRREEGNGQESRDVFSKVRKLCSHTSLFPGLDSFIVFIL